MWVGTVLLTTLTVGVITLMLMRESAEERSPVPGLAGRVSHPPSGVVRVSLPPGRVSTPPPMPQNLEGPTLVPRTLDAYAEGETEGGLEEDDEEAPTVLYSKDDAALAGLLEDLRAELR